ncbi:hypothetical protein AD998_21680 [bacterium 336/3]|nr:hypothetical protein AD998_21680 [bacterium 336/3]
MKKSLIILLFLILGCKQLPNYILSKENPEINKTRKAVLLSAFFGLDNAMPQKSMGIWNKAPGKDGMPLVFSHEIDPATLNSNVFQITTQKGDKLNVAFATFKPAIEAFELRTILLIGEFGNAPDNKPKEVEIISDLKTRDGQNLKGQKIKVTPLKDGPFISYAEYFSFDQDYPYSEKGRGCDCPKTETETVVRTVWAGGIRATNGKELGEKELTSFTITLIQNSDTLKVHPFHIADLDDNDNNIDLCIKVKGTPILVETKENTAIDPRGDHNPITKKEIIGRWK